jgi:hypothetical protein
MQRKSSHFFILICQLHKSTHIRSVHSDKDDDAPKKKSIGGEWNMPKWTQNLVVKPNEEHLKKQVRLWGVITALGWLVPPSIDYLGRFTWLICVAQLSFRGQSKDALEGSGGMGFSGGAKSGLSKVSFFLGMGTWMVASLLTYSLMPSYMKGLRYTPSLRFTMTNLIFGVACSYLQPFKG